MALPFLKKKSEAAAAPLVPAWHPNFRNYEKLPDIKVVRTAFFINGAAISLALALAIYLGVEEWSLHVLSGQIAEAERQVSHDKAASDQALALFKKFEAEEARFNEVDAFMKSKPLVSDLFIRLAQTLPTNIAIDSLDLRDTGLALHLTVRGTAEAATAYANTYLEQLRADKQFARFDQVSLDGFKLTNVQRNTSTGRLNVDFLLSPVKAAPAPAAPAAAKKP
jgi:hypothetical protein